MEREAAAEKARVPIWPLVIIHALIDFTSFIASGQVGTTSFTILDVIIAVLVTVAFSVYAIYFMRPSRQPAEPVAA